MTSCRGLRQDDLGTKNNFWRCRDILVFIVVPGHRVYHTFNPSIMLALCPEITACLLSRVHQNEDATRPSCMDAHASNSNSECPYLYGIFRVPDLLPCQGAEDH